MTDRPEIQDDIPTGQEKQDTDLNQDRMWPKPDIPSIPKTGRYIITQ